MTRLYGLLVFLLSLLAMTVLGMIHFDLFPSIWAALPAWLGRLLPPVLYVFPSLVVILVAGLLEKALRLLLRPAAGGAEGQAAGQIRPWRKVGYLFLAALLLLTLAYVTYWESLWDQTYDGLGGIWLAFQASLAAVLCGAVLGMRAKSWHRSAGFAFALLVPVLLLGAFFRGWAADYQALTRQRADRIAAALNRYQAREGDYPVILDELVPEDLLWVPSQVILRQEAWCYQGGGDSYVLAAYWRKYFSSPLEVQTYASNGCLVKSLAEACQSRLSALQQRYDPPPIHGEP
jgi:hypothetical protein